MEEWVGEQKVKWGALSSLLAWEVHFDSWNETWMLPHDLILMFDLPMPWFVLEEKLAKSASWEHDEQPNWPGLRSISGL